MSRLNYVTGGYTPLMMAAEEGNLQKVQDFVKRSKINERNESGYSALALAVKKGHFDIAIFLIDKGADVNSKNNVRYN